MKCLLWVMMTHMGAETALMNTIDLSSVKFRVFRDSLVVMCQVNCSSLYVA